jgi:hypothetical protein
MLTRMLTLSLIVAVVLVLTPSLVVFAADDKAPVEGTVVKAAEGKLTIEDKAKTEHTCEVAKDAKITCDGKECKLDELKKGVKVKVTVKDKKATKIEASTK